MVDESISPTYLGQMSDQPSPRVAALSKLVTLAELYEELRQTMSDYHITKDKRYYAAYDDFFKALSSYPCPDPTANDLKPIFERSIADLTALPEHVFPVAAGRLALHQMQLPAIVGPFLKFRRKSGGGMNAHTPGFHAYAERFKRAIGA